MQSIKSINYSGTSQDGLKLKVSFSSRGITTKVRKDRTQSRVALLAFDSLMPNIERLLKSSGKISKRVADDNPTVTRKRRNYTLIITIPSGVKKQR